jgi:CheY-like chemotaxis protein
VSPKLVCAGGTRVLVIDDNADSRESLRLLLSLHGYDALGAADGPDGLRRAQQWRPAVVVSDIGLPGMNGWELARRLRAELGADVLLVALTGHCRDEDRERSADAGFDAHLSKPLELATLLRLLGRGR